MTDNFRSTLRLVGTVAMLVLGGCLSTHSGSASLAYVDIVTHGVEAVREETIRVLADDSYQLVDESDGLMTFEREATQRDQLMYGRVGEQLVMRVVVSVMPGRIGGSLVRADAYVVRGSYTDPVLRIARRPYQDLLNRVKASLVSAAPVTAL